MSNGLKWTADVATPVNQVTTKLKVVAEANMAKTKNKSKK